MRLSFSRHISGVLAAACMLTMAVAPTAQTTIAPLQSLSLTAAATSTYGDLTFEIYSDHIEITDCDMSATSITIPSQIGGLPVRVIADRAFYGCSNLQSITIANSVQIIGNSAFTNCSALTTLTLPTKLTAIGDSAFSGCTGLTSLQLPSKLTQIGKSAFHNCTGLTALEIPATVTIIGSNAFSSCSGLQSITVAEGNTAFTSVDGVLFNLDQTMLIRYPIAKAGTSYTVPDTVTTLASFALESCAGLTEITLPSSLTTVGAWAFAGTSISSIQIPNRVTSIEDHAFCACTALTDVQLSSGLQTLGAGAFWGCTALTDIVLPDQLLALSNWTFYGCSNLNNVTIPKSVASIETETFNNGSSHVINIYGYEGSYAETFFNKLINNATSQNLQPAYTFNLLATPEVEWMLGDADQNGEIQVEDAVLVLQTYAQQSAGLEVTLTDDVFRAMDVDGDGVIAVEDAVAILTYYAKTCAGLNPEW